MKKPVILIVGLFAVSLLLINAFDNHPSQAGDDWQIGINWADASITQEEIISTGKPVYLFVTTEWCTFCKKMKAQTFTDPKIQKLLNELFIAISINPEKPGAVRFTGENLSYSALAKKLKVGGYPASFFFDSKGKMIGGRPGFIDPGSFADIAEYVGDGHHAKISFTEFKSLPPDQRR
jgi:thioredoxin-related protein